MDFKYLSYQELAKLGLWKNKNGDILNITKLPNNYLHSIVNYCPKILAEYIYEEFEYRSEPTPKWLKDWLELDLLC